MTQAQQTQTHVPVAEIRPEGLYRWDDFADRIPFSRETWRQRMQNGRAPKPAMQSRNCTAWRGTDVLAWLANPESYKTETAASNA